MITTSVIMSFVDFHNSLLIHDFKVSNTAFKGALRKKIEMEIFILSATKYSTMYIVLQYV